MKIGAIMIDLFVAVKHLHTLPFIFGKIPPLLKPLSEINIGSYSSITQAMSSVKSAFIGDKQFITPPTVYDNNIIFFLNGICTDVNVWGINAKKIENLFRYPVYPLHNTTEGFFKDIVECIFGRTFNIEDNDTKLLYQALKKSLIERDKVILFAHSQGAIIASQLIEHLMKCGEDELLKKLELYTFAGAMDEMPIGDYYAEHYANTLDYVARIGVLEYRMDIVGRLYIRQAAGHLLNIHYLQPFKEGLFCQGTSRLFSYLR